MLDDEVTKEMATRYLKELQNENIDSLILGCTHYPLLRKMVGKIMGPDVCLVNPAYETAIGLRDMLSETGLSADEGAVPSYEFYVSDDPLKFKQFANTIMPTDIGIVKEVNIENF